MPYLNFLHIHLIHLQAGEMPMGHIELNWSLVACPIMLDSSFHLKYVKWFCSCMTWMRTHFAGPDDRSMAILFSSNPMVSKPAGNHLHYCCCHPFIVWLSERLWEWAYTYIYVSGFQCTFALCFVLLRWHAIVVRRETVINKAKYDDTQAEAGLIIYLSYLLYLLLTSVHLSRSNVIYISLLNI